MKCEWRYNLRHNLLLQPKGTADYFTTGTLFHRAMQIFLHPINEQIRLPEREGLALEQIDKLALDLDASQPAVQEARRLFRCYVREYGNDPGFKVLSVEQKMSIILLQTDDYRVTYGVTLDALGRSSRNRLAIGEHKTASKCGSTTKEELKNSPQILGCAFVARAVLKEEPELAILNIAVKTKQERLDRVEKLFNSREIDAWHTDTVASVRRLLARMEDGRWIKNRFACRPRNQTKCPYLPLCDFGHTQTTLSMYEKRPIGAPKQAL
jgi:hypothetical protein